MTAKIIRICTLAAALFATGYQGAKITSQTETPAYLVNFIERVSTRGIVREHRYILAGKEQSQVRVNIAPLPDGTEFRVRVVQQPGTRSIVIDSIHAKSTQRILQMSRTHAAVTSTALSRYTQISRGKHLGFDIIKLSLDEATAYVEIWLSPELGNLPVRDRRLWKDAQGAIVSETDQIATEITVGDPDPALFDIPSEYEEMKPSDLAAAVEQRLFGRLIPAAAMNTLLRADETYRTAKTARPDGR